MVMPVVPHQLILELDHGESFAREDFIQGAPNASALALIERWPDWPDRIAAIVGPQGSGKTHLASIWTAKSGARSIAASALSEAVLPAALASGALVLDDLIPGQFDERTLFHLLNLVREEKASLLITARSVPGGWSVATPDLGSRLRAIPVITVAPPDERLLRAVLLKLAADRQMALDESVVNYLIIRIERSIAGVQAAIQQLDREAMRQKRPITRALAAEIFRDGLA